MKKKIVLDPEEQQILKDFENGVFVTDTTIDLKLHAEYARNTLKAIKDSSSPSSVEEVNALARAIRGQSVIKKFKGKIHWEGDLDSSR